MEAAKFFLKLKYKLKPSMFLSLFFLSMCLANLLEQKGLHNSGERLPLGEFN